MEIKMETEKSCSNCGHDNEFKYPCGRCDDNYSEFLHIDSAKYIETLERKIQDLEKENLELRQTLEYWTI